MNEISFELLGKKYDLYFGMDAYEIIVDRQLEDAFNNTGSTFKACSYVIFGGLVNNAIIERLTRPSYKEAYKLTENIFLHGEDLQNRIFDIYNSSVANDLLKKAVDNVTGNKKKVEGLPKKASKRAGTK